MPDHSVFGDVAGHDVLDSDVKAAADPAQVLAGVTVTAQTEVEAPPANSPLPPAAAKP